MPSDEEAERILQNAARVAREKAEQAGKDGRMVFSLPAKRLVKFDPNDPEVVAKREEWERGRAERERQAREAAAAHTRASMIRQAQRNAGIPPRYETADLSTAADVLESRKLTAGQREQYVGAVKALQGISTVPGMLALVGIRGSGKTFLACATVNQFCGRGQPAVYRRVSDVFLEIKDSFGNGNRSQREIIRDYARPELLVLDEIQVRSDTNWENVVLTDLIDRRYAAFKSTLFIANLTPEEFQSRIGDSVTSRIRETGGVIVCDWPSFR